MNGLLGQRPAVNGLLDIPVTANRNMLAQAVKARNKPEFQMKENTLQGILDGAAMATSPVPILGDLLGLSADGYRFATDPTSRNMLNYGLAALGALPFVPSGVGAVKKMTQFEKAHEVAQKNAALPVSQGGLGLPPNNTAMDRAKAMGFDTPAYHGTTKDFKKFDVSKRGSSTDSGWYGPGEYSSPHTTGAEAYAMSSFPDFKDGANIMPIMLKNPENIKNKFGYVTEYVTRNPNQIRSKFAAFDPDRKNSSDLLANVAPFGLAGLLGLGLYDARQGD